MRTISNRHAIKRRREHRRKPRRSAAGKAIASLAALARFDRHSRPGDDPGRRRDAPHRFRPFHHRVEAGDGRGAAALRQRLARGIRRLPPNSRVPVAEAGHEPRSVQDHLLVGVGAPLPWAADRCRLPGAVRRLLDRRVYPKAATTPSRWPLPAWRTARRGRLVHGEERPRRPHRCQPVPARRPSRHRRDDLRLHALAHPSASAGEGGAGGIAHRGLGRRHRARPHLPPDPGRRVGRRPRRWRRLQHLAGDQWGLGAGRARRARALVPQSVRESG